MCSIKRPGQKMKTNIFKCLVNSVHFSLILGKVKLIKLNRLVTLPILLKTATQMIYFKRGLLSLKNGLNSVLFV